MNNIQSYNDKYKTIESILDKTNDVNTAIIRRLEFKNTDLYKEILEKTRCLDVFGKDKVKFCYRVMFLHNNMALQHCPKCNLSYVHFQKAQTTLKLCNHKKQLNVNFADIVNKRLKDNKQSFVESLSNKSLFLHDDEFKCLLKEISEKSKAKNYAFLIAKKYFSFYHDCILKTEKNIPINFDDLRLNERIYVLNNNLSELPKCKYCGKLTYFKNRIVGYADSCTACENLKHNDTLAKSHKISIENTVDLSKYEIVKFPKILNIDTLKIKCRKCGKTSEWKINNGKINLLKNMPLCKSCEAVCSKPEEELFECLKVFYNGKIIHKLNSRKIIYPKELDIYIPEKKLAIEFDGLYWHSENVKLEKTIT